MVDKIIKLALEEDLGLGDITSDNIFPPAHTAKGYIVAKDDMILCGMQTAEETFHFIDKTVKFKALKKDGDKIKKGDKVVILEGKTLSILKAERTALNFLQRMSAIASMSNECAAIGKKYGVMIVDTRKSLPGMRRLDKYAVKTGGARNHRMSLSDTVLIKDNHIAAAGSITAAVKMIKSKIGHTPKIEVEVTNLKEVKEALLAKADIIMLDNMSVAEILKAKALIKGKAIIEVSGGINRANLEEYAKTKVNVISLGALTHSVPAKDLSLKIDIKKVR
ncbi:nicotinate-nucleotide pyrophosphorylase (carboxylating) [Parelusimicrobium proximum]|uniref:carboxylating nicotinate-nucleotide diphosphorylase n=1 Tax=Parelusimicrobium proximum TaxID=3228953 RepID=UPI003D179311